MLLNEQKHSILRRKVMNMAKEDEQELSNNVEEEKEEENEVEVEEEYEGRDWGKVFLGIFFIFIVIIIWYVIQALN